MCEGDKRQFYWIGVTSDTKADYLCAILNSETARAAAEHWQSEGQWGKRDFDKAVFNLPIPMFNAQLELHQNLAKAAARAEKIASQVELKDGEHFTRTHKRIRLALIENGVAGQIETMVAALIGVAPPATLSAGSDEPDVLEEQDGDDAD